MSRLRFLLLLLFPTSMFWYVMWETDLYHYEQGQSERSSSSQHDRKHFSEASTDKNYNSTPSNGGNQNCPKSKELAKDVSSTEVLERRLPNCLIIGFAKCGTYALKSFLTLHPNIVAPNSEISFFTKFYSKGLDWYRRQMPMSTESAVTLEKTPNYIMSEHALSRIRKFNSSIRLIISVRDPITRLQSSFAHAQAMDRLSNETFESWLAKDGTIARVADYEKHIRDVFRFFNRSQILLIEEERLASDPMTVMRNVEQFLGLCHAFTDELLRFDQEKGFFCFNQSSPRYNKIAHTLTLNHANGCFSQSKGRNHPAIGQKLQRQLAAIVSPYNNKLFALVGQRFNWTLG